MVNNPYNNLNDRELMLKYQNGDHMAFNLLYLRHKDKVYHYLSKRLHHSNEVDDLFQRVFTKFHQSRHLYSDQYEVLPWLYTVCKSEFLDFIKKKRVQFTEFNEEEISTTASTSSDSFIDLQSENSLTENEKNALHHRYYEDKEFYEIAFILNTSESNARKIISRGLQKIRSFFQKGQS